MKLRDWADRLIWATVLISVIRYAAAFAASDVGADYWNMEHYPDIPAFHYRNWDGDFGYRGRGITLQWLEPSISQSWNPLDITVQGSDRLCVHPSSFRSFYSGALYHEQTFPRERFGCSGWKEQRLVMDMEFDGKSYSLCPNCWSFRWKQDGKFH